MVAISDSSLRANVFETIYDLINSSKSGWTTVGSKTINLYSTLPDDNPVFPCIVVNHANVGQDNFSLDSTTSNKNIIITIEVYSVHNKDIDTITDGVMTLFDSSISGMFLVDVEEDSGIITPNEQKLKQKTITLTFMRR